ncbi:hypothetical protein [Pseudomonas fluorescens]|uniref:hypothetical protein n=1 Tax=Pseudomonas fluorescens TaxID=294 RepID=UPI0010722FC4|nr:hypothetical protein [Pseudomonas fluorescens]
MRLPEAPAVQSPPRQNALNTTVAQSHSLSDAQLNNLKFLSRLGITPLKLRNFGEQTAAKPSQISELRRDSEGKYYFDPTEGTTTPKPYGVFLFVVKAKEPYRILAAPPYGSETAEDQFKVQGHTSISLGEDVLYAGYFTLNAKRELEKWSNGSGHYLPPASLHQTNLLPELQSLLPSSLFVDHWSMNKEERNRDLAARGYFIPIS